MEDFGGAGSAGVGALSSLSLSSFLARAFNWASIILVVMVSSSSLSSLSGRGMMSAALLVLGVEYAFEDCAVALAVGLSEAVRRSNWCCCWAMMCLRSEDSLVLLLLISV